MPYKLNSYEKRRLKILGHYTRGTDVLDIGYAAMPNPYLAAHDAVGLDLMPAPQGSETIYKKTIQGDIKDIKELLPERKFDTIICGELIEHLENPYDFLRDLRHLLKDTGILIISTPNPFGFPVNFCEFLNLKTHFYSPDHTYLFLPRWVRRMLKNCHYRLAKTIPVGFWGLFFTIPLCPIIFSYQVIYIATKDVSDQN